MGSELSDAVQVERQKVNKDKYEQKPERNQYEFAFGKHARQ